MGWEKRDDRREIEVCEILNEMDRVDGDLLFTVSSIMPTERHQLSVNFKMKGGDSSYNKY